MEAERVVRRTGYLDGWRGVSIALVLIGHFTSLALIYWGTLGVNMFFALSGRLMGEILWEQQFPVSKFLLRRFSRVWPALFVFVVAMLAIDRFRPLTALAALTFTYGYYRVSVESVDVFGHLWSLCIEEHSYLILLALAIVSRRNIRFGSIGLIAVSLFSIVMGIHRSVVLREDYFHSYWLTDSSLHFITLPVLAYLWRDQIGMARMTPYASPLFVAMGCAMYYHRIPFWIAATLAPPFLSIAIAKLPDAVGHELLEWRPLRQLGLWSFSIYLWQEPFLHVAYGKPAPVLALAGIGGVVVGILSFRYIEGPARAAINSLGRFRRSSAGSRRRVWLSSPLRITIKHPFKRRESAVTNVPTQSQAEM